MSIRFTDGVIDAIHSRLAMKPPEQGAALLGFGDLVTLAVLDSFGTYSPVSWDISSELGEVVQQLEAARVGTLLGTVHSHPTGVTGPSGTDIESTVTTLRLNPHLPSLLVAIVTRGEPSAPEQLPIGTTHRMSLHSVALVSGKPVVTPVTGSELPLCAALDDGGAAITSLVTVRRWRRNREDAEADLPRIGTWRGREALFAGFGDEPPLALVVPEDFPATGPALLSFGPDGVETLPAPWDPSRSLRRQVRNLVRNAQKLTPRTSFERAEPLIGDLGPRSAAVFGLGSVGSRIAEDLVRSGVGTLTLVDPERVDAANLARSVYTADDLGERKTSALARRLRAINPGLVVSVHDASIGDLPLAAVLAGIDLVVGATDDMREQLLLAHHAYSAGIPMVACAMYAGARAGELVLTLPAAGSPCIACCLGDGRTLNQYRPDSDYGLKGRLVAEPGLGPSIQLVSSMASMMAMALLSGPESSLADLVAGSVGTGRTLAMIATHPGWDFFPELFSGAGHQLAPQSIWAGVERDPACVVCGPEATRVAPPDERFSAGLAELISAGRDRRTP